MPHDRFSVSSPLPFELLPAGDALIHPALLEPLAERLGTAFAQADGSARQLVIRLARTVCALHSSSSSGAGSMQTGHTGTVRLHSVRQHLHVQVYSSPSFLTLSLSLRSVGLDPTPSYRTGASPLPKMYPHLGHMLYRLCWYAPQCAHLRRSKSPTWLTPRPPLPL